ncbi:MAG: DeoR/GlpR family DNA-binding transcription regulator [Lachnospiraceae bacterium]|nr:DeoR/GlpR family DNA-binding transcription regulator [Lachnospiraceae bacterium]
MIAIERRNGILEKLQEDKRVVVSELSQLYKVSEETIRRDLERLEKEGLCIKSYGGAVINENNNMEMPFNVRKKSNASGKQKIAEMIAGMVEDGEHILLDASTTAVYIAKALKNKKNLTVITNSIEVLIEVSDRTDWNVISLGGNLKEGFLATVGVATIAAVREYKVEKAIVSCKAFDPEDGFYDTGDEFAKTKRAMVERGQTKIMAIDSTKFGKSAFAKVMDTEEVDLIITDRKPQKSVLKACEGKGIRCMYPEK